MHMMARNQDEFMRNHHSDKVYCTYIIHK